MPETLVYIEALMGVSGDMFLGALIDAGVPVEVLHDAWDQLDIDNYEIEISEKRKSGMRALQCLVRTEEKKGPRLWKEYRKVLDDSGLKSEIKSAATSLCEKLFRIEAEIHR